MLISSAKLLVNFLDNHFIDASRSSLIVNTPDFSFSTSLQVVATVDDPYIDLLSLFLELTCPNLTSRELNQ